jgi:hypothetical protein
LRRVLLGNYSNIEVYGEEYPIHFIRKLLSKLVWVLQMLIVALALGGENVRRYFNFIPRQIFDYMDQKKWIIGLLAFLGGNMLQGVLTSSGAFEIFAQNKLVMIIF